MSARNFRKFSFNKRKNDDKKTRALIASLLAVPVSSRKVFSGRNLHRRLNSDVSLSGLIPKSYMNVNTAKKAPRDRRESTKKKSKPKEECKSEIKISGSLSLFSSSPACFCADKASFLIQWTFFCHRRLCCWHAKEARRKTARVQAQSAATKGRKVGSVGTWIIWTNLSELAGSLCEGQSENSPSRMKQQKFIKI